MPASIRVFTFACVFVAWLQAAWPASEEPPGVEKLSGCVYARIGSPDGNDVGNAGFVVMDAAVVVFDTHFTPEAGQALAAAVRNITPKPVRYVVLSHYHPDHTHGAQAFGDSVSVISSAGARRDILQRDIPAMKRALAAARAQIGKLRKEAPPGPGVNQALAQQIRVREEFLNRMTRLRILSPVITVEDRMTIEDPAVPVRLIPFPSAHTEGDLALHVPSEKVVFAGDLFFNAALPNVQDANLIEWPKALTQLLALDAETFVPGHGAVGSRADVTEFAAYLEQLRSLVEPQVSRGDSLDQVLRETQIPERFASYAFPSFFAANVQKMYAELKALQLAAGPQPPEPPKIPEPVKPTP